jgi:hypothetical protein
MHERKERRPAGDRTAFRNFDNITERGFNACLDGKQEATAGQLCGQLAELRFRHAVERLHRLGPRPLYEMLVEVGASRLIRTEIERQVERYAALDRAILHTVGGNRFPAAPLHLVHVRCPRT